MSGYIYMRREPAQFFILKPIYMTKDFYLSFHFVGAAKLYAHASFSRSGGKKDASKKKLYSPAHK
jgi:hypothetical protein